MSFVADDQFQLQRLLCERIAHALGSAPIHDPLGYEALACLKLPGPDYLTVLRTLHMSLRPHLYVEIGVRQGKSLRLAHPSTNCIAIDPQPLYLGPPNTLYAVSTSDSFFAQEQNRKRACGFDLAFIDGDHSAEQVTRDFENLAALAGPHSIIALHDVIPMDERTSAPQAQTSFHTGDAWRVMAAIVEQRPDLTAFTVACPPTGLGIVGRFWTLAEVPSLTLSSEDLPADWDVQVRRLRIVNNDARSVLAAFNGEKAA